MGGRDRGGSAQPGRGGGGRTGTEWSSSGRGEGIGRGVDGRGGWGRGGSALQQRLSRLRTNGLVASQHCCECQELETLK